MRLADFGGDWMGLMVTVFCVGGGGHCTIPGRAVQKKYMRTHFVL